MNTKLQENSVFSKSEQEHLLTSSFTAKQISSIKSLVRSARAYCGSLRSSLSASQSKGQIESSYYVVITLKNLLADLCNLAPKENESQANDPERFLLLPALLMDHAILFSPDQHYPQLFSLLHYPDLRQALESVLGQALAMEEMLKYFLLSFDRSTVSDEDYQQFLEMTEELRGFLRQWQIISARQSEEEETLSTRENQPPWYLSTEKRA